MDDAFDSLASPSRPLGLLAESRVILVEAIDAGPLQTRELRRGGDPGFR